VRHTVLRPLYPPHRQHHRLFTGPPSLQTNSETENSGTYRKASSIIHHHLKPLRLTKDSFSTNNNSPDNGPSRAGTTSIQSGTSTSSGYRPLSYNSYPLIIKKSSHKEAASPFRLSEVGDAKEALKSPLKGRVPRNDFASLFLSQTGRYRSSSPPMSRGQQPQRKVPTKEVQHRSDNANPLYRNANVTHGGFTRYRPAARISPWIDAFAGRFVPVVHADVPGNSAVGGSKSLVGNATTRGSTHASTPLQATKNSNVFRGFDDPQWRAMKELPTLSSSGSDKSTNLRGYSFDKGRAFKSSSMNPPVSPKYSFGQRKATATEGPLKGDASPSPGTHRGFTSGFKEARPGLPESDAGVDGDPDLRWFRSNKIKGGLKAFGTQSLEGDMTEVGEPDESVRVRGFKLPSLQIWEPKSSRMSPTEPNGEDHTPPLRPSSPNLGSAALLDAESEPKAPDANKPSAKKAHLLHSSTSNTVRGKRVRAKKLNESTRFNYTGIDALIWRPPRVRATNNSGTASASLSDVTAATRTPITPTASAAPKEKEGGVYGTLNSEEAVPSGDDASRGPEEVWGNKLAVGSEDVDLFLDNEGSGSGVLDASDVLPTATTKRRSLREDLSELEYVRLSPWNLFDMET